jgi:hypothetical protein
MGRGLPLEPEAPQTASVPQVNPVIAAIQADPSRLAEIVDGMEAGIVLSFQLAALAVQLIVDGAGSR